MLKIQMSKLKKFFLKFGGLRIHIFFFTKNDVFKIFVLVYVLLLNFMIIIIFYV